MGIGCKSALAAATLPFYVEQAIGALQEELMPPLPFGDARSRKIVTRAENIPSILEQGKRNLKAIGPFAQLTIELLADIRGAPSSCGAWCVAVVDSPTISASASVLRLTRRAGDSLTIGNGSSRTCPNMRQDFALGDNAYGFFLHQVALLPYIPAQLAYYGASGFPARTWLWRAMNTSATSAHRN